MQPIAPTIDPRLRERLEAEAVARRATAAEITRALGELAWQLGLARPCYEQVRVLVRAAQAGVAEKPQVQTSRGRLALRLVDGLWEYPGPYLGGWYERYRKGL